MYIELSHDVDPSSWPARHAAGTAADATPYGLHHLEDFGHQVRFQVPSAAPLVRRAMRLVSNRAWEMQPVHTATSFADPARRTADVVLCMDERTGVPAVLTSRSTPVVMGAAWLDHPSSLAPAYAHLVTAALRRAAGVFVECSAMLEPLEQNFGIPRERLHFVTLGIDADHFGPTPLTSAVPGRVFSVGDDRMRDYGTLTEALRMVRDSRPQVTAEIATTLPIELPSEWATVHRRRMDHAVKGCYERASVVALALKPTIHGSGLTVVLEAMASGRPVVATDNPGLSDYIVDGETGFLVPGDSPQAMADAVAQLIDEPDLAARMGQAGRSRVEQGFTTARMACDLDRVLKAALRSRNG